MGQNICVRNGHRWRVPVEDFIRATYQEYFGASIANFPSLIVARFDSRNELVCAAGIRTSSDGFFSESYLDEPVEDVLSALSGVNVDRGSIFEVSTLVSRSHASTRGFVEEIISLGEGQGFSWSFFTATHGLAVMLERWRLKMTCLARADQRRIGEWMRWGNYYSYDPRVFAVASGRGSRGHGVPHQAICDAQAV
jgi:hypothetical protein